MTRIALAVLAAIASTISACAPGTTSIDPRVLEAADPDAAGAQSATPVNPLDDGRPRTLELEIADPTHMHHPEKAPEVGTPEENGGIDHRQHATPTPTPPASKRATPTPTPQPPVNGEYDQANEDQQKTYACPMHPEVRDTKPSSCLKCGMRLEPVEEANPTPSPKAMPSPAGHEHHHGHGSAP